MVKATIAMTTIAIAKLMQTIRVLIAMNKMTHSMNSLVCNYKIHMRSFKMRNFKGFSFFFISGCFVFILGWAGLELQPPTANTQSTLPGLEGPHNVESCHRSCCYCSLTSTFSDFRRGPFKDRKNHTNTGSFANDCMTEASIKPRPSVNLGIGLY